jgi:hypothetical protein
MSPRDCALAFTFPITRERFFRDLEPGSGKDFVRSWVARKKGFSNEAAWMQYEKYARYAQAVAEKALAAGVLVALDVTLADWAGLVRQRRVMSLFAHWHPPTGENEADGKIEFSDSSVILPRIIDQIPEGYSGILDLAVCNSIVMGTAIKQKRPRCTVILNRHDTRMDIRLVLYRQALRALEQTGQDLTDVLANIHLSVLSVEAA